MSHPLGLAGRRLWPSDDDDDDDDDHLDKYLLSLNCFSNSSSCWEVNAVRGRLVFPRSECG